MALQSTRLFKQKFSANKRNQVSRSRQTEHRLSVELLELLTLHLGSNDSVMVEVPVQVLGEFLNILSDKYKHLLSMFQYEQLDKNKFVFSTNDIVI
jgi:hypothetical protein